MQGEFECWVDVPRTDARIQVSNRGRLRVLGKKQGRGRHVVRVHVNEERHAVCDYKTGTIGWYVFFDGEKHFFARDELARLFPESVRDVDSSHDDELRRMREETFRDLEAERAKGDGEEKGADGYGT